MTKRRMSTFERLERGRLNRKQRRELGRQVAAADTGLTIVHANAGGIEVDNQSQYVAVPPDRDPNPVREFGCWTAALNQIAEWLQSCRIDTVAMQAILGSGSARSSGAPRDTGSRKRRTTSCIRIEPVSLDSSARTL